MSKLTGLSRLGAIFLALTCFVLIGVSSASAQSAGCLPGTLKSKLNEIRSKFGPVKIVSTHRRGARIAGSGRPSYHASCRAVDFHPPKGKHSQVVAYLKKTHSGGVGTYSCGMNHIHLDNGPRVRFHHCVNASGTPIRKGRGYASKGSKKRYASAQRRKSAPAPQYANRNSQRYAEAGGSGKLTSYAR